MYSRLLRFKSAPDVELPSLAVECELCDGWKMEDERSFVFHIRQDVWWQDVPPVDGRRLTAGDIAFSYDRQRGRGRPNAALLGAVRELEAPRPDVLRISLTAPDADFLSSLADGHSKIVATEAVSINGDLRNGPTIGTGPWILKASQPDVSHTFVRNPNYFEEGLPFVEDLVMHILEDADTRDAAFKVGVLDVRQMEPREWLEYREGRPDAPSLVSREPGVGLEVALKASAPPFDDVRVRRAVFLSMDPWTAKEEIWSGFAFVSLGFPAAQADWLLPEEELKEFFGGPQLARGLLEETGLQLPVPLSIRVGDFGEAYLAHAQRVADEMEGVGFEPTVETVNRRAFGEEVWLGGDYTMFVGPTAPVSAPNGYLLAVLHSQGRWNTTEHRDDELDVLLEAQAREFDSAARKELVQRIQRRVLENAYRFMPATRTSIWTWWPRVRGFHPNFAGFEYFHWARVWLSD